MYNGVLFHRKISLYTQTTSKAGFSKGVALTLRRGKPTFEVPWGYSFYGERFAKMYEAPGSFSDVPIRTIIPSF